MKPGGSLLLFNLLRLLFPRVDSLERFFLHAAGPEAPAQAKTCLTIEGGEALTRDRNPQVRWLETQILSHGECRSDGLH